MVILADSAVASVGNAQQADAVVLADGANAQKDAQASGNAAIAVVAKALDQPVEAASEPAEDAPVALPDARAAEALEASAAVVLAARINPPLTRVRPPGEPKTQKPHASPAGPWGFSISSSASSGVLSPVATDCSASRCRSIIVILVPTRLRMNCGSNSPPSISIAVL